MEIRKTEAGFAIKFPFALKDAFRAAFPSAKWDAVTREWTVGPRSGKRLQAWVAECQQAADDIAAREEAELAEAELAKVRAEIAAAREQMRSAVEYREQLEATRAAIEAAKQELAQAAAQAEAAQAETRAARNNVIDMLKLHVDLKAIDEAKRVMSKNMNPADRLAKQRFDEARQIVRAERDKLHAAGLTCDGISLLACANVNRPDRDHPRDIPGRAWFTVRQIEPQDE